MPQGGPSGERPQHAFTAAAVLEEAAEAAAAQVAAAHAAWRCTVM